jgi:hypothetical protein
MPAMVQMRKPKCFNYKGLAACPARIRASERVNLVNFVNFACSAEDVVARGYAAPGLFGLQITP